ncbi:MAG: hypothetical protein KAS92_06160 [Candidatus Omnitrophica bacterium]|nr:hypothetical protein [Candidatus Omnitrophota bacterium]
MTLKPKQFILTLCGLGLFMSLSGCEVPAPKALTPSEAHHKLVSILKEENGINVVTKEFKNALWIYLPLEESFLQLKANTKPAAAPSSTPESKTTVHFLDVEFNGQDFVIRYDIGPAKKYAKDPGYQSLASEAFQTNQRYILTAISRAYASFEEIPDEDRLAERVEGDIDFLDHAKNADHKRMVHSYVKTDRAPNIFVIVMADIENGIESRIFLHLKDLRRAATDATFHEEYAKRVISDHPFGDPAIVGDQAGAHVDFHEITIPEFLAKQIVFRVNFKYTRSAFPPSDDSVAEILKAAATTVASYDFKEFSAVELQDLSNGAVETVERKELARHSETFSSPGRLIRIEFK